MILVFAGAGASYAINREKYPTTIGFFSNLDEDINNKMRELLGQDFYYIINKERKGLIGEHELYEKIDIEDVLWLIEKMKNSYNNIFSDKIFKHVFDSINGGVIGFCEEQCKELSILEQQIYEKVFDFYLSIPSDDELYVWISFLNELLSLEGPIELFTTNYDVVLDGIGKHINSSFENGLYPDDSINSFYLNTSYLKKENKISVRLIKLHGSAKWQRQGERIICDTGNFENGAVLYPGSKGFPEESPFIEFYHHLEKICKKAEKAIFIGFSFRDAEINKILKDINENCQITIINKGNFVISDGFPFDENRNYNIISTGFDTRTIGNHREAILSSA